MDPGNLRHRDRIESQPVTPVPSTADTQQQQQQPKPPSTPIRRRSAIHAPGHDAPCTRVDTPACPNAAELGTAAVLFQIAQSQTHPNPQQAVETLRKRLRENLQEQQTLRTPKRWTVLRDMLTTTDSRWIPALRWTLLAGVAALLGALLWNLFAASFTSPLATAAASLVPGMIAF